MTTEKQLVILLVEDDPETCSEIENAISTYEQLRLAAVTNSSTQALELTKYHLPDVVILDLELHKGEGNGILYLKELSKTELNLMPFILVTTNNPSAITHQIAKDLGADLTLTKTEANYSSAYVIDTLFTMKDSILRSRKESSKGTTLFSPESKERKLKQRVYRELNLLGVSPKLVGYQYLVDAIIITYEQPTSNIASILAKKYSKTAPSIERAMQNAINRTWNTSDVEDLLTYYTAKINPSRAVPTTMEFVYYYARKLQNELY